jgi:diguanylate cyclase (GGDEF)-like protein
MRDILELCIRMDELADRAYESMAESCVDREVGAVLGAMAIEESAHTGWWRELVQAWDNGLLPDVYADTDSVRAEMTEILRAMEAAVPPAGTPISAEDALTIAVNIEFFMLDPMFGELLDLAEPAVARVRHDAYARHIDRLVSAVEKHYEGRTLAGFLARVLRRSWRENRTLATYAMRDQLTGLANRRAFTAHLKQWTAWSARYGRPIAVILLDVDLFKRVNDTHGHAVGDAVLLAVAKAVASATRASDMSARYGGDEFAVLAPETGPDEARHLAERIMDAVREVRVGVDDGSVVSVTVSIGSSVAVDRPDSEPRSIDELLAGADQGLYAAKRAGRDRASDPLTLATAL